MDRDTRRGSRNEMGAARWRWPRAAPGLVVAGLLVFAAEAGATCEKDPAVCAREAFAAGTEAFAAGELEAALADFRLAQELRPHPVVLFNVALTEVKLGQVVAGLGHLRQVYDDPETPEHLLGKVRTEQQAAARLVAVVILDEPGATLVVDGVEVTGEPPRVELDPGPHELQVVEAGEVVLTRALTLAAGEQLRVTVAQRKPRVVAPPTAPAGEPPAAEPLEPTERDTAGPSPRWLIVGGVLTAGLAGATVWSGLDTRSAFRDYEAEVDALDPAARDARITEGKRKQLRTNVLIGATSAVGLATLAAAVLVIDWPSRRGHGALLVAPGQLSYEHRF